MQLFLTAFESVPDPRAENVRHDLVEIILIAFLAVLCGAQHCSEMAEFGCAKLKFLKRFLKLRHGSIARHVLFRVPGARPESSRCSLRAAQHNACGGASEGWRDRDRRQVTEGCLRERRKKLTQNDGLGLRYWPAPHTCDGGG